MEIYRPINRIIVIVMLFLAQSLQKTWDKEISSWPKFSRVESQNNKLQNSRKWTTHRSKWWDFRISNKIKTMMLKLSKLTSWKRNQIASSRKIKYKLQGISTETVIIYRKRISKDSRDFLMGKSKHLLFSKLSGKGLLWEESMRESDFIASFLDRTRIKKRNKL